MINSEIAKIFYEIADILEMRNVEWKPQAYRKAAKSIENLKQDLIDIYDKGGLKALDEIPGIGSGLAKKIEQYIKIGKIKEYERVKKLVPKHLREIMGIPGMGPKKAELLYEKLGIKTIADLEKAIKEHKIAKLFSFGSKSEGNIKKGLVMMKKAPGRIPLEAIVPIANKVIKQLKPYVNKIIVAGSIRRKKPAIRDIDILATSKNPDKVIDIFTKMKDVKRVLGKGSTKSTIILKNGIQADLRIVPEKSFGAAVCYFTGNKEYNIKLRQLAIKKGYKLSEYGLFDRKTGKFVAGRTEKEIYAKLGMKYIPPEKRVGGDEIKRAMMK